MFFAMLATSEAASVSEMVELILLRFSRNPPTLGLARQDLSVGEGLSSPKGGFHLRVPGRLGLGTLGLDPPHPSKSLKIPKNP